MDKAVILNDITVRPDDPNSMFAGWKTIEKMASKLCWQHVTAYGQRKGYALEDLMQQAYLTYDRVIRTYDSKISDSIITYLYCSIRDDLKSAYHTTDKTRALEESDSLDAQRFDDDGEAQEASWAYIASGDARQEAEEEIENQDLRDTLERVLSASLTDSEMASIYAILDDRDIDPQQRKQALRAARMAILDADEEEKEKLREYISYI